MKHMDVHLIKQISDIMANILAKKYDIVYDVEEADVIILNTCYVKLPTEQKMITKIR